MKRRKAGRMGRGGKDMCHTSKGIVPCNAKKNRADGARKKAMLKLDGERVDDSVAS